MPTSEPPMDAPQHLYDRDGIALPVAQVRRRAAALPADLRHDLPERRDEPRPGP